jgi:hypothetical protein
VEEVELFFMVFNDFYFGKFKGFTDEHLENRLDFKVKVKKVLPIIQNGTFIMPRAIGHVNSCRGPINEVIRFNLSLINHVIVVTEGFVEVLGCNRFLLTLGHRVAVL